MLRTVAIDMGASSSKAVEGLFDGEKLYTHELLRLPNGLVQMGGAYFWDIPHLVQDAKKCIKCACTEGLVTSFGIDTWGASMGMIDAYNELLAMPRHYRDQSYRGIADEAFKKINRKAFFEHMGCSLEDNIALFQCFANRLYAPKRFAAARYLLMCSDLIRFFLTGEVQTEETIGGTGGLIEPYSRTYNESVMNALEIPIDLFPVIVPSGTYVGQLSGYTCRELGIPSIKAIAVAGHDTASATLSFSISENDAFLILGTWGLLGITSHKMYTHDQVIQHNCVNELNPEREIRFLRNIPGLWIYNHCVFESKKTHEELMHEATQAKPFGPLIDIEDNCFSFEGNMKSRIEEYLIDTNQPLPTTDGGYIRCILESMALKYRCAIEEMVKDTNRKIQWLNITGGGIRNILLLKMIGEACGCGLRIHAQEGSAIGNILMQLVGVGELRNVNEARELANRSFPVQEIALNTDNAVEWEEAYDRYRKIHCIRKRKQSLFQKNK